MMVTMRVNRIFTWPSLGRTRKGSIDYQPIDTARRTRGICTLYCSRESRPRSNFREDPLKIHKHSFSALVGSRDRFHRPPTMEEVSRQSEKRQIRIDIHGQVYSVDSMKIRDACSCKLCVDPSTTQKLFNTVDVPVDIRATLQQINPDGSFSVSWTSDISGMEGHISQYPPAFLSTMTDRRSVVGRARREIPRIPWSRDSLKESKIAFDFNRYLNDPTTFRAVTKNLMQYGIAFISSVPPDPGSVGHIANRIGPVMKTIYGEIWDVRSVESPKNVADRDSDLGFHMVCVIQYDQH